jgi:hypothetical protein
LTSAISVETRASSPDRNASREITMSISCAPSATAQRVSSNRVESGV